MGQYVVWILGILGFGWWGVIAVFRPGAMDASFLRGTRRMGFVPGVLEKYLQSRWRRVELRIAGVLALGVSAFMLYSLIDHLSGALK